MTKLDFLTKAKFSRKVEETVKRTKLNYMDSVLHICEEYDLDPSDVKKFLSNIIRDKIEAEAKALNFLPREENTLPI